MTRSRGSALAGVVALSALWLLGSVGPAARAGAQTVVGPSPVLRILSPQVGDVVEPTLDVVVVAEGRSGTTVHAELLVDGAAVRQAIHVAGDQGARVVLSNGTERTLLVRDLPEGRHTIRLVPAPGDPSRSSAIITISVRAAGGVNLAVVLIAAALVGVLVLYRRKILDPGMRRFQPPPEEHPTT